MQEAVYNLCGETHAQDRMQFPGVKSVVTGSNNGGHNITVPVKNVPVVPFL